MERSIGGRPAVLFVLTPANQFCCAETSDAGCKERQTKRFRHRLDYAGIGLNRQKQDCNSEIEHRCDCEVVHAHTPLIKSSTARLITLPPTNDFCRAQSSEAG